MSASPRNADAAVPFIVAVLLTIAGMGAFRFFSRSPDAQPVDGAITPIARAPSAPMARQRPPADATHGGFAGPAEGGGDAPDDDVHAGVRGGAGRRIPTHGEAGGAERAAPDEAVHAGVGRPQGAAPSGMPPMAGMSGGPVETDGDPDLPVKKTGISSAEELARGRAAAKSDEARAAFERGFRLTFTTRQDRRGYAEAVTLLRRAIDLEPGLAEAYRALGYAVFNTGGGFEAAIPLYQRAVEIRPTYGEAHYALAFFLGESDRAKGREHFKRAKELGVPDERGLGPRYYPDVN